MRLRSPDRKQQGQGAAERRDPQAHQESPGQGSGIDPSHERPQRQGRQRAGHEAEHRHQPRGQFAQHDLGVGEVGHQQVGQRPSRLVQADRSGRRRGCGQQEQDELSPDDRLVKGLPRLGLTLDGRQRSVRNGRPPNQRQARQQDGHKQRTRGIDLPTPRRRQPLVSEDRSQTHSHAHVRTLRA